MHLRGETVGRSVRDDSAAGSAAFRQIRSRSLRNLPRAGGVRTNHTSRPGGGLPVRPSPGVHDGAGHRARAHPVHP
ncbi:hypothetical protein EAO71_13485 [Streptomyces sp. ms191]|nr:hypothetical protein EAO71_13485 [Streptomyces sp. ms191]